MLSLDWQFKKHIKNEQKNPILQFVCVAGIGSFSGFCAAESRHDLHQMCIRDSLWYMQMWMPFVTVGILQREDLVGYRTGQVYIRLNGMLSYHSPFDESIASAVCLCPCIIHAEPLD